MQAFLGTFDYRPLKGSEIRLVHINREAKDGSILCTLEHALLADNPKFFALSYVWGNPNDTSPIHVDKQEFPVTRNLYEALCHLRDRTCGEDADRKVPFWIDAISINQKDLSERSEQVPRMRIIYSKAAQVVAWLGLNTLANLDPVVAKTIETDIKELFTKLNDRLWMFAYVASRQGFKISPNQQAVVLPKAEWALSSQLQCHVAIAVLLSSSWFERVWVVQEAALAAQQPILVLGSHTVRFDTLCVLECTLRSVLDEKDFAETNMLELTNSFIDSQLILARMTAHRELTQKRFQSSESTTDCTIATFATELYDLWESTAGYVKATDPRDRI